MSPMKNVATLLMLALFLASCGSDNKSSPSAPSAPSAPPPTPSAVVEFTGSGTVTLHPSINRTFRFAVKYPIRIRETGGGTATWNFFRVTYFKNSRQVERYELTASDIRSAGYSDIAARSDQKTLHHHARSNVRADGFDAFAAPGRVRRQEGRSRSGSGSSLV